MDYEGVKLEVGSESFLQYIVYGGGGGGGGGRLALVVLWGLFRMLLFTTFWTGNLVSGM